MDQEKLRHYLGMVSVCMVVLALLVADMVSGHGLENEEQKTVGNYIVEFAYGAEILAAGEPIGFTFRLANASDQGPAPFDSVSLRVKDRDEKIILAGDLAEDIFGGQARLVLAFARTGTHYFELGFMQNDRTLVETSFEAQVVEPAKKQGAAQERLWLITLAIGLVLGVAGGKLPTLLGKKPV